MAGALLVKQVNRVLLGVEAHLAIDALHVALDRLLADGELVSDVAARAAACEQREDLGLARGEASLVCQASCRRRQVDALVA